MQLTEKESKAIERFVNFIMENEVSDAFLVQIIELAGGFADIESIQARADKIEKTYNGVKKTRNIQTILGQQFVVGKDKI